MITAKEAKKKTFESDRMKEMLKEKHYKEVCETISRHIIKQAELGYFFVDLKTSFMYPFRDRIIEELRRNGYKVELCPSYIMSEHLMITWEDCIMAAPPYAVI